MKNKDTIDEKFTKEQIINSEKYKKDKDILTAILKTNKTYTKEEVDIKIKEFKERKV